MKKNLTSNQTHNILKKFILLYMKPENQFQMTDHIFVPDTNG